MAWEYRRRTLNGFLTDFIVRIVQDHVRWVVQDLGLAIAREMIMAHGGDIWAESEEGKGTTIFFTLPFELQEDGEWD